MSSEFHSAAGHGKCGISRAAYPRDVSKSEPLHGGGGFEKRDKSVFDDMFNSNSVLHQDEQVMQEMHQYPG